MSSCGSCCEVPGPKPCLWFWRRGCYSWVRLSGAPALFYLFFLLSISMRSSKHWSWIWSCNAKLKESEALLQVPCESQPVFHTFPACTRRGEVVTPLQASLGLKIKAVFGGSPFVSKRAEHVVKSSLADPRGGRVSCNSQLLDVLGGFYLQWVFCNLFS